MEYIEVAIEQDDSGHEYIVPISECADFEKMMEAVHTQDSHSDGWYNAVEAFVERFDKYRCNVSNKRLFVLKEEVDNVS